MHCHDVGSGRSILRRSGRRPSRGSVERLERRVLLSAVSFTGNGDGVSWADPNNWSTGGFLHGALSNPPLQPGDETQFKSVVRSPDDIYLAVAGGPAGGWAYFLIPYGPIAAKAF